MVPAWVNGRVQQIFEELSGKNCPIKHVMNRPLRMVENGPGNASVRVPLIPEFVGCFFDEVVDHSISVFVSPSYLVEEVIVRWQSPENLIVRIPFCLQVVALLVNRPDFSPQFSARGNTLVPSCPVTVEINRRPIGLPWRFIILHLIWPGSIACDCRSPGGFTS